MGADDSDTLPGSEGAFREVPRVGDVEHMAVINPEMSEPARPGRRYSVGSRTLGRLERLAKARWDLGQLAETDLERWEEGEAYLQIAQSVNASSQIEDEHIHADELHLLLAAITNPQEGGYITPELSERAKAVKSIYETYYWLLTMDRLTFIDLDLVLNIHKRMFESTKGESAGSLKNSEVLISGAGYRVTTLPPEKTPQYLRELCDRTNHRLHRAQQNAEEAMLLITAEFIVDFLAIHPFRDGNGRTARLLSTYLLERAGYHFARFYPLDEVILESRSEYYRALYSAQRNWLTEDEDLTEWIEYYVNAIFVQYLRAYQRVLDDKAKG